MFPSKETRLIRLKVRLEHLNWFLSSGFNKPGHLDYLPEAASVFQSKANEIKREIRDLERELKIRGNGEQT